MVTYEYLSQDASSDGEDIVVYKYVFEQGVLFPH